MFSPNWEKVEISPWYDKNKILQRIYSTIGLFSCFETFSECSGLKLVKKSNFITLLQDVVEKKKGSCFFFKSPLGKIAINQFATFKGIDHQIFYIVAH